VSTKILTRDNGPLFVEGEFTLVDASGKAFGLGGRTKIALCRCGQSANKPLCDGTHGRVGFSETGVARDLPPPAPKP
jgi:CDGSH-type Zn-finger protein